MKKLLYTLLAVSIIFAACKKEEDDVVTQVAPSIVGDWTPTSASVNYSTTAIVVVIDESISTEVGVHTPTIDAATGLVTGVVTSSSFLQAAKIIDTAKNV